MSGDDLAQLAGRSGGWRCHYQPRVGSTMDLARAAARAGAPDRSVFVTDYQESGRGRQGRQWQAPSGTSLLFTLLLRAAGPPIEQTRLAAVALAAAIERTSGLLAAIKWPNDLMVGDAKLAGLLTESYSGPPTSFVLVGCGLNVNQSAAELAPLGRLATSMLVATGRRQRRHELLLAVLAELDRWLAIEPTGRSAALRQAWDARLWRRGAPVRLNDGGEELEAVLLGSDEDGALLVRTADGARRRVVSGEILLERR
jgi:BirA family transcriptional regulator, biotin operon repressor / biotin---[acetyl-CoA-carboxylase] ligase